MPQRRQEPRRFLATVLFTDIVGSTERASTLGDRAWRDVLERHNAVVRRELKSLGGREMDTAGDGFFAVFESPEGAVRCAESITAAVAPLGIEVRAGVHLGECEVIGGKVGGITVTIGARISALAGPGEVLVSGSVRDLMTGSGQQFDGGEQRELKGVADKWRVYRLVPDEFDGDVVPSRRTSMVPLYTRRQGRRLVRVIAGVLVVALAVAGGYLLTRPKSTVVVPDDAVGVIGPGDQPRVSAAVGVGQRPSAVASGFGSVWVTNSTDDSVSRIDRRTKNSVPINVVPGSSPSGVATGAGAVWVANTGNATVSKIDPATSRVTTIPVRSGPTGIVVAFGSVWVANASDAKVSEIDPDTDKVVKEVPVGAGPAGIAAGAGYLWVTNQGDGTVTRFLPNADEADSPINVGNGPLGIAIGDDAAWVANNLDGSLSRIDLEDLSVTSRTLVKRGGAYGVAAHGRDVWVSNENASSLMRVTTPTFQLGTTVPLRGAPLGLAFVGDDLWFTSAAGGSVHRGGVLTMVAPAFVNDADPPVLDPLTQGDSANWRLAAMTNDGLVGFRRAGGVQGAGIVPDLATTLPKPTKDGLTYAFHLRKGVRYSTGAPVLAGDIRRGIERAVVHPDSTPNYYALALVGGKACADAAQKAVDAGQPRPDCDLGKGITADDRTGTITFHLIKPTPEFLYQLALPIASAVPQDTPVDLQPGAFLPATGPYKVGSYSAGRGRLELVRNPHFHVWSPAAQPDGYPDKIVLETGYTAQETVARVTDGRADIVWNGVDPYSTDVGVLGTRYGSQLHTTVGTALHHLFLNATKPPFNSLDARRAVAYAIDRRKLTTPDTFLGTITCQFVPPNFQAYQPYCPFTAGDHDTGKWAGPDLAAARESVRKSGTRGAKVVVTTFSEPAHIAVIQSIVDTLNRLGYRASVNVVADWPGDFNATVGLGWADDYPTPSSHVGGLGSCDPDLADLGSYNVSHYCDPKIDKQIVAALVQEVTDPGKASDTWAAIDREMVDAAAIIPFQTDTNNDFVSRRVGNPLIHPITGPLIAQMWVQ